MDRALTHRIEQQVRQAFPEGVIAGVQVLQYGDDPEVEPIQAAMRVFFDWPGRPGGGQADPQVRDGQCRGARRAARRAAPCHRMGRVPPGQ